MSTTALLDAAVHQHPVTSANGLLERAFTFWFNAFVYNQIWEDPRVDLEALQLTSESRIVTIASGGCNVLNYLIAGPAGIVAVDLNRNHLALLRLKLAGLAHLPDPEAFFRFFGAADDERNHASYAAHLSPHLDRDAREIWEGGHPLRLALRGPRISAFTRNFYDSCRLGDFLRLVHLVAKMHGCRPERVLAARSLEEQAEIYADEIEPVFDHWLIRSVRRMPAALFSLGIPPQQFRILEDDARAYGDILGLLRHRVRRLACDFPIGENYFAWQAFSRRYDRVSRRAVPEYLKAENFPLLQERHGRVDPRVATFHAFLATQPAESHDRFVLLDSQDWMRPAEIAGQWREMARVGRPGSRIVFRTAGSHSPIESALPPDLLRRFTYEVDLSQRLLVEDRSAIYGGFHVYTLR
jgi:S-adenosylmethionine-diacylglycerol 3-amino-3-carboxypropyl transferase